MPEPHRLSRRIALGALAGLALPGLARGQLLAAAAQTTPQAAPPVAPVAPPVPNPALAASMDALRADWAAFRGRFMAPEGRLVDTGNNRVSHSEGQGYGLLLAVRADDRASFDKMLAWTRRVLKRRNDTLSAWRFTPDAANPVADQNNASDGDLFISWALLEAGRRWGQAEHTTLGTAIARDVLKHVVRRTAGQTLLLPGARGFDRRDRIVVNPSYYAFPAIRALAQAVPDPAWVRLATDGLGLLRAARFGKWNLPPDWLSIAKSDGALSLPDDFPPRFSFDAVRVPLYLAWARLGTEPAVSNSATFWADPSHNVIPAWVDLTSNTIAPYAASPGVAALARFASAQRAGSPGEPRGLPALAASPDYYSAVLGMLVRLAWSDLFAPAA